MEISDIIGDAKVWTENGELHARLYFANDDEQADHAWAVSDNASYSIGTEWFEEGYYGADENIDGFVGILREIGFDRAGIRLRTGDILLLLSDGATTDGTDWIRAELEAWREGNAQELAEHITRCARRRCSSPERDDITVMAAILEKAV